MGCKADFAANSTAIGKKFNAADRPNPVYHGPRGVMQRVLYYRNWFTEVHKMTEATLLIKRIPVDLKQWLAVEAARNDRSMNKEAIRLLEEARASREIENKPSRDAKSITRILEKMRSLPTLDARHVNDMLYHDSGMPK